MVPGIRLIYWKLTNFTPSHIQTKPRNALTGKKKLQDEKKETARKPDRDAQEYDTVQF